MTVAVHVTAKAPYAALRDCLKLSTSPSASQPVTQVSGANAARSVSGANSRALCAVTRVSGCCLLRAAETLEERREILALFGVERADDRALLGVEESCCLAMAVGT